MDDKISFYLNMTQELGSANVMTSFKIIKSLPTGQVSASFKMTHF